MNIFIAIKGLENAIPRKQFFETSVLPVYVHCDYLFEEDWTTGSFVKEAQMNDWYSSW